MSETSIVELKYPVTVTTPTGGALSVNSVTIRRLKAKDLKFLPEGKGTPAGMLPIIAAVTGLSQEVVDEIDVEDITKIAAVLTDFSAGYLGSGDKSSGVSPQPTTSLPLS